MKQLYQVFAGDGQPQSTLPGNCSGWALYLNITLQATSIGSRFLCANPLASGKDDVLHEVGGSVKQKSVHTS